ncbi:MAG: serine/threonine-protein kinase [Myxococcota bacterium]|nr:serine/threonine-protein kinase [Myxococcota bacterium]
MTGLEAQFGRYVFLKKLAEGGMAEIFLAQRRSFGGFGRFVVIKRLLPEHRGQLVYERLFLEEARIVASLKHPNVVNTYDLGKFDDAYFMVMEYIHGVSGAELLTKAARAEGSVEYGAAVTICAQIAKALDFGYRGVDFAHDALGIVHHDISPHNLQIGYDGSVKLLDYGVATQTGHDSPKGRRGKYAYMTPEVIAKEPADHRSDLFSLAVILYEFTVGRRLFKAKTPKETMNRIQTGRVPKPTTLSQAYPPALEGFLEKALSTDPDKRYQTGLSFADALIEAAHDSNCVTGTAALAGYMRSLFYSEIETRRDELVQLSARLDESRDTTWTSSHNLIGTGDFDAVSDETDSQIAAPAGRETNELNDVANLSEILKPSNQSQLPMINRLESPPLNALASPIETVEYLPAGVNDTDTDWSRTNDATSSPAARFAVKILGGLVLALGAALIWALQRA